jgi:hypothetical protein
MDVVLNSATLEALLNKEQNSIEYQTAKIEAENALSTKEEYAILVWNDEDVKDMIAQQFDVAISDEHAIDILDMIEETHTTAEGINMFDVHQLYKVHLSEKYKDAESVSEAPDVEHPIDGIDDVKNSILSM